MLKRHFQRGQALPVGLVLIMASALTGLVLFNTGQLATEKTQLANTADAAVYSGLVWQARSLNFQAYTNRAMVANQVSIAQIVSLASWAKYAKTAAANLNNTIGWIPPLKPSTQGAEVAAESVNSTVVDGVAQVIVPILDKVNAALSEAQRTVFAGTFAATSSIVKAVVERNDERYKAVTTAYSIASLSENAVSWNNLTSRYSDDAGLKRKARTITDSLDAFSSSRSWSVPSDDGKQLYLAPVLRVTLVREGGTRLLRNTGTSSAGDEGKWAWKAKDTLSLHVETYKCSWRRGCRWKSNEIPIGWGKAYVKDDLTNCESINGWSASSATGNCNRWMNKNNLAEKFADVPEGDRGADVGGQIDLEYSGVRAYYDLKDLSESNKDPRLRLSVEVEAGDSSVRTSSKIDGLGSASSAGTLRNGIGKGAFRADDKLAASAVASIATGEVYFKRPVSLFINSVDKKEYASLYNPYWQVRLHETTVAQRSKAWLLRDPGLASSSAESAGGSIAGISN